MAFRGSPVLRPAALITMICGLVLAGCSPEGALTPPAGLSGETYAGPVIYGETTRNSTNLATAIDPVVSPPAAPDLAMQPVRTNIVASVARPDRELVPEGRVGESKTRSSILGVSQVGYLARSINPFAGKRSGLTSSESACRSRLKRLGVKFTEPAPIRGRGACGIAHPVKISSLSGGIQIKPAATLNCPMAEAFAKWVKSEVAPAARRRYLSGIRSIHQMSSYSCRTMNSKRGAPLSEHAKGNAIDVGKITLNSGRAILVRKPGLFAFRQKGLLNSVRADSCKYFTTVLGPGSDVHHRDHFHFDLRRRKSGYRHCD